MEDSVGKKAGVSRNVVWIKMSFLGYYEIVCNGWSVYRFDLSM